MFSIDSGLLHNKYKTGITEGEGQIKRFANLHFFLIRIYTLVALCNSGKGFYVLKEYFCT